MRLQAQILAATLAAACTSSPPIVSGGELRNETPAVLHHVRAVFRPTQRVVFANQILPGRAFSLGFSPREMQSTHAELTWRTADGQGFAARLDAPSCPPELANTPTWVVYSIRTDGSAAVRLAPAR